MAHRRTGTGSPDFVFEPATFSCDSRGSTVVRTIRSCAAPIYLLSFARSISSRQIRVCQISVPHSKPFWVDCGHAVEPELRGFRPGFHDLIVLDEATPQFVLSNRRVLQSPAESIRLGQSSTNIYAYSKWLHAVRMVATANSWDVHIAEIGDVERQWLEVNSVLIHVREPLWLSQS